MSDPTDLHLMILSALENVGATNKYATTLTDTHVEVALADGQVVRLELRDLPGFLAGVCSEHYRLTGEDHPLVALLEETDLVESRQET